MEPTDFGLLQGILIGLLIYFHFVFSFFVFILYIFEWITIFYYVDLARDRQLQNSKFYIHFFVVGGKCGFVLYILCLYYYYVVLFKLCVVFI